MSDGPAGLLVVDDTPTNLDLLAAIMEAAGHSVRTAASGEEALRSVREDRPELILLDIMMPGMDGYETCRRLKADPALADIPVIFISALDRPLDKVRALSVGGVDYVSKPIHVQEVRARVATHLRLARLRRELETRNRELETSNATQRELEAQRDSLVHMLVHDMRSPLTTMLMSLEVLRDELGSGLDQEQLEDIDSVLRATKTLARMADEILDVNRIEQADMPIERRPCDLREVATAGLSLMGSLATDRVVVEHPEHAVILEADPGLLQRVVANLVSNALKHTPEATPIRIAVRRSGEHARLEVQDEGPGIPGKHRELIFEKFGQVRSGARRRRSPGLGLAYCKLVVEAHGGRIGVDSELGVGSTFWLELPG